MSDGFYRGDKLNVNKEEKAHWIYDANAYDWNLGGYVCSNCLVVNSNLPSGSINRPLDYASAKFCPYCGKEMEEPRDDFIGTNDA